MTDQTAEPASASSLLVVSGRGAGAVIPLPAGELVLGRRAPQAGALADDPLLSRQHARITTDSGGQVWIEDLGSSNGTRLNGKRLSDRQPVRAGDLIEVGGSTLKLAEPSARAGDRTVQFDDRTVVQAIPGDGEPLAGSRTGSWDDPLGASVPAAPLFQPSGPVFQPPGPAPAVFSPASPLPPVPAPAAAAAARPAGPAVAAPSAAHGTVTLTGRVRGFERRSERMGEGTILIFNFRLERYDSQGNRERPVAVQLRGWKIDGSLRDEDEVIVTGHMKNGTLRGDRVENLTTGASVAVQSVGRGNLMACLIIIGIFFVITTLFGVFALLGS